MNLQNFAFVMCRLLSIYLIVCLVLPISGTSFAAYLVELVFLPEIRPGSSYVWFLGFIAIYGLPACFLWFKADKLSKLIAPNLPDAPDLKAHTIQYVLFSSFGLGLLIDACHDLWNIFFYVVFRSQQDGYDAVFVDPSRKFDIAFMLIAGTILLFGSRRLVAFMRYLRYVGTK